MKKNLCLGLFIHLGTLLLAQLPASMSLVPSGLYIIGKESPNNSADFSPEHEVQMDSFYIDCYEVTNAEYKSFCKATGHKLPYFWNMEGFFSGDDYPNHPVIGVSYYDALKYAEWCGKRLPTEAEWEIAARGTLTGQNFPNGATFETCFPGDSILQKPILHCYPVDLGLPNAFGLFGMAGNVWEWTSDWYAYNYYEHAKNINPTGPDKGKFKTIRGGGWKSGASCCRVFHRNGLPPNWVDFAVGFRCVKDVKD